MARKIEQHIKRQIVKKYFQQYPTLKELALEFDCCVNTVTKVLSKSISELQKINKP